MNNNAPSDVSRVSEMVFADLYLGHPEIEDRFTNIPRAQVNPVIAGPELRQDLDCLKSSCIAAYAGHNREFRLLHDGVGYRVAVMETLAGLTCPRS